MITEAAGQSRGLTSVTLDRLALDLAKRECPKPLYSDLTRYSGTYLILGDDDRIVTVARRKRRFRR